MRVAERKKREGKGERERRREGERGRKVDGEKRGV